jgi:hypothetical protein
LGYFPRDRFRHAVETLGAGSVSLSPLFARTSGMNPIDLIVTVCAVLSSTVCKETHLTFFSHGSLQQCVMAAQPYIARWAGEHPKWTAVRWRCEYPHGNDKADAGRATLAG